MLLYDAFRKKDLLKFQQLLDRHSNGIALSSPNLKSRRGTLSQSDSLNVNARDQFGRTILHHVASYSELQSLEFATSLLSHPSINVNLQDFESGWTPLHRALYAGNLSIALTLLSRNDTDVKIKDFEGNTALDVLNSTVEGTNPEIERAKAESIYTEIYTWGVNTSYVLGRNDMDTRVYPERVFLQTSTDPKGLETYLLRKSVPVKDIAMTKFHTGVITCDIDDNYQTCGFGVGGRLGLKNEKTQFTFKRIGSLSASIKMMALGLDHTILVTFDGAVWTFGSNKHCQLGYVVETKNPRDDPIQTSPRKVVGQLKKEIVIGAAASRVHSVVFTKQHLFTWGSNIGQLGYDTGGEAQISPRKVSSLSDSVIQVAATDNATACLLTSHDVIVYANESHVRVIFPMQRFTDNITPYRPAHYFSKYITKLSSGGQTFAALSSMGDVFVFSINREEIVNKDRTSYPRWLPKPQRVWSLRKKFLAVKDIAVGQAGDLILCTESGHVYVRDRRREGTRDRSKVKSNQLYKFTRVPFLQRAICVRANEGGGFAAIRSDVVMKPIKVEGSIIGDDLRNALPHYQAAFELNIIGMNQDNVEMDSINVNEDDDYESLTNLDKVRRLVAIYNAWDAIVPFKMNPQINVLITSEEGRKMVAHKAILAARSAIFQKIFSGECEIIDVLNIAKNEKEIILSFPLMSHLSLLIFVEYLYTDQVIAVWDPISIPRFSNIPILSKIGVERIRKEVGWLAKAFHMNELSSSLNGYHVNKPSATLAMHLVKLMSHDGLPTEFDAYADTQLLFKDKSVKAHSILLKHRCLFFEAIFGTTNVIEESGGVTFTWLSDRKQPGMSNSLIDIDLRHFEWEIASVVMRFLHGDEDLNLLKTRPCDSLDAYVSYLIEVLAASNELLLSKLKLICQIYLQNCVTVNTALMILSECDRYSANELTDILLDYVCQNLETMLESGDLEELDPGLIIDIEGRLKEKQRERLPISKSGKLLEGLMTKYQDEMRVIYAEAEKLSLSSPLFGPSRSSYGSSYSRKSVSKFTPLNEEVPEYYTVKSARKLSSQVTSPQPSPALEPEIKGDDLMFAMDDDIPGQLKTATTKKTLIFKKGVNSLPITGLELNPNNSPSYTGTGSSAAPWKNIPRTSDNQNSIHQIMAELSSSPITGNKGRGTSVSPRNLTNGSVCLRPEDEVAAIPIFTKMSQRERKQQGQTVNISPHAVSNGRNSLAPWSKLEKNTSKQIVTVAETLNDSTVPESHNIGQSIALPQPTKANEKFEKVKVPSVLTEVIVPVRAQRQVVTPTRAAVNAATTVAMTPRESPWSLTKRSDGTLSGSQSVLSPSSFLDINSSGSNQPGESGQKLSFAAIQAQQVAANETQKEFIQQMRKKSLIEIQEEERAQKEKEAFESWFDEEVKRLQKANERARVATSTNDTNEISQRGRKWESENRSRGDKCHRGRSHFKKVKSTKSSAG